MVPRRKRKRGESPNAIPTLKEIPIFTTAASEWLNPEKE